MAAERRAARAVVALASRGGVALPGRARGGGGPSTSTAAPAIKGLPVKATVAPKSGTSHTDFVVSFTAGEQTGRAGQVRRSYVVAVRGPSRASCVFNATAPSRGHAAGSPGQRP